MLTQIVSQPNLRSHTLVATTLATRAQLTQFSLDANACFIEAVLCQTGTRAIDWRQADQGCVAPLADGQAFPNTRRCGWPIERRLAHELSEAGATRRRYRVR